MSDILFTHSYFLQHDAKEYRAMMPYPPLGTLYAAAHMRDMGYSVGLFDAMLAHDEGEFAASLDEHHPGVVVLYDDDFHYLSKMCLGRMRIAALAMVSLARERGCRVIVHGSDATDHAAEYLQAGAEAVLVGEAEHTLGRFVEALSSGSNSRFAIEGVLSSAGGTHPGVSPRLLSRHPEPLAWPARDLVDMQRYRGAWIRRHGYFSLNMVTTRGCPYKCNWCAKPIYGNTYNARTPVDVADELEDLRARHGPDHLWFCDDIFGLKPGWVEAFADEVTRRNIVIPFKCQARADLLLRDDMVTHLRRAGCVDVWIGAESGSQKILDAMDKGITVGQITSAARELQEAGIHVGFFIQFGYPGELRSDIDSTLRMIRDCRPDNIGVSVSYPLPGTRFYDNVRRELGAKHNWSDSQDLALLFRGTFSPDYYRVLHTVTHKLLRIQQGKELLLGWLRHPRTIALQGVRRVLSGAFHQLTLPRWLVRLRKLEHPPATTPALSHSWRLSSNSQRS